MSISFASRIKSRIFSSSNSKNGKNASSDDPSAKENHLALNSFLEHDKGKIVGARTADILSGQTPPVASSTLSEVKIKGDQFANDPLANVNPKSALRYHNKTVNDTVVPTEASHRKLATNVEADSTKKEGTFSMIKRKISISDLTFMSLTQKSEQDHTSKNPPVTGTIKLDKNDFVKTSHSDKLIGSTAPKINAEVYTIKPVKSRSSYSRSSSSASAKITRLEENNVYYDKNKTAPLVLPKANTRHTKFGPETDLAIRKTTTNSSTSSRYSGSAVLQTEGMNNIRRGRSRTIDAIDVSKSKSTPNSNGLPQKKYNFSSSSLTAKISNRFSNNRSRSASRTRSNSKTRDNAKKRSSSQGRSSSQARNSFAVNSGNSSSNSSTLSKNEFSRTDSSPRGSSSSQGRPLFSSRSNSSNSTRKRSGSLANALSSLVNLKSNNSSAIKVPGSEKFQQPIVSLSDLPPVPSPQLNESYRDYLIKLSPYQSFIGVILTQEDDTYKKKTLNYFLKNCFDFKDIPIDVALRELLMFLELPKETQQIDRLLQEFSVVYYEEQVSSQKYCGWLNENQVYFIVFSLLMLHTDFYNPNNKNKMSKLEFINLVMNDTTSGGNKIPKEILSYFHDNITSLESPKFDLSNLGFGFPDESENVTNSAEKQHLSSLEMFLNATIETKSIYSPKSILANKQLSPADLLSTSSIYNKQGTSTFSNYLSYAPNPISSSGNLVLKDDIGLYSHICNNTLSAVIMESFITDLWDSSCVNKPFMRLNNTDQKVEKFYSILHDCKGGYLKIHRNQFEKLAHISYEVLQEAANEDYLYLKIIQMGKIQELSLSKKYSLTGSHTKLDWREAYAMLTSYGLLVFENFDWITPQTLTDKTTQVSNYIIDYKPSAVLLSDSIIDCKGLLTTISRNEVGKLSFHSLFPNEYTDLSVEDANILTGTFNEIFQMEDPDFLLYVQKPGKRYVWKCPSYDDRDNWVDSINLIATYSGCFLNIKVINNTVVALMKKLVKEQTDKLLKSKHENTERLKSMEHKLSFYRSAIPMSFKTKANLDQFVRQLAVKMDKLLFEIKKCSVYIDIVNKMNAKFPEDGYSVEVKYHPYHRDAMSYYS